MPTPISRVGTAPRGQIRDLVFFVDLDGTLKSESRKNYRGNRSITCRGNTYSFDKRPGADEFLKELHWKGKVFLFTAASKLYAKKMLIDMGLSQYVDKIYARDSLNVPSCENFVFIDDDVELACAKMKQIGDCQRVRSNDDALVTVATYQGEESDDELVAALKAVNDILGETRRAAEKEERKRIGWDRILERNKEECDNW